MIWGISYIMDLRAEVEVLRFFALDALPDGLSKGLQRRLAHWPGKKKA